MNNVSSITGTGTTLIGMQIYDNNSEGNHSGTITLTGAGSTGVYNNGGGKFTMTDGSITTSGGNTTGVFSNGGTNTTIEKGVDFLEINRLHVDFDLQSKYEPKGDQINAIAELTEGLNNGENIKLYWGLQVRVKHSP